MRYPTTDDHHGPAGAPLNPWLSVWLRPRATMRYLSKTNLKRGFIPAIVLTGLAIGPSTAESAQLGDYIDSLSTILTASMLIGPFLMLASVYISAYMLKLAGRRGDGKATFQELVVASTWPCIPIIIPSLLYFPRIFKHGIDLFTQKFAQADWSNLPSDVVTLEITNGIVSLIFAIWSLVLFSHMIAQAQGFTSAWKGLRNYLLAMIYLLLIVFAIALPLTIVGAVIKGHS